MATIAENLQTIKDSTAAIKQSIINKGGEISGNITTWASAIDKIDTGGGAVESKEYKDVNFFDYEGTILYSYTWEEAKQLTEMPPLPDRTSEGLVCEGWNWTLEEMKAQADENGENGYADVGAIYTTIDEKDHFHVHVDEYDGLDLSIYLGNTKHSVVIEWGDGESESHTDKTDLTYTHVYADAGEYVVKIKVVSGSPTLGRQSFPMFGGISKFANSLKLLKAHVVKLLSMNDSFSWCQNLEAVTITKNACRYLHNATLNSKVTHLNIPYIYREIKGWGSLNTVSIYGSATVDFNGNIWQKATCATVPRSVSVNNGTFQGSYYLKMLRGFDGKIKVSTNQLFQQCYNIRNVDKYLDLTVTSIGSNAFNSCYSLESFICPPLVKTINASAFTSCYALKFVDFTKLSAIPTLVNTNAFTNVPKTCEIRVPKALEEAWKAATNWSTYADYIVGY